MGMFKQMKQMVGMVNQAPAMIDQARLLQQQAQAAQAAQAARQAQYGQAGRYGQAAQFGAQFGGMVPQPGIAEGDPRLAPIEGVTLADYARISKFAATHGLDLAGLGGYVASLGFDPQVYHRATEAWNARFKGDMALAAHYGGLYQEAQV
ncbi:hypothetical protein EDD29_3677 [Actinocorallia herbida]|uniref:Uncharacterized protein n=1 Tax=Actinocorallia herbida TaxID=58109 RepID=A0A3N1CXV3_9ACTN|nr:hypothetical protein [Actinocorallia herbida]ROO86114.1 hypothetical protein EDD29_3677 [Actinocorallia herbida]